MIFQFKAGTEVEVLTSDLLLGLLGLAHIMETHIGKDAVKVLTITSVNDGIHKTGSLHYSGNAVDIRSKIYKRELVEEVIRMFRASTDGPRYDLLLEAPGTPNEHLHLEYDPKHENNGG